MKVIFFSLSLVACGGVIGGGDGGIDASTDVHVGVDSGTCSCSSTEWCKHDPTCGSTKGTCTSRPVGCPDLYAPTCGEDTHVYANECEANAAGVDSSPSGGCIPPTGFVSCGAHFCDATTSYCQSTGNDAVGPGDPCTSYACLPLPTSCLASNDCACFGTSTPCSPTCTWDGSGFQLVCFGG